MIQILPNKNVLEQQFHSMSTDDVENTICKNKADNLLTADKLVTFPRGTETISHEEQRYRRAIIHWSTDTQWEQDLTKKPSYGLIDFKKAYGMALLKIYKTSDEIIKSIENTMKISWIELTARGKSLVILKTQKGNLKGDAQSLLLFVIAMMPLDYIIRKCTGW